MAQYNRYLDFVIISQPFTSGCVSRDFKPEQSIINGNERLRIFSDIFRFNFELSLHFYFFLLFVLPYTFTCSFDTQVHLLPENYFKIPVHDFHF